MTVKSKITLTLDAIHDLWNAIDSLTTRSTPFNVNFGYSLLFNKELLKPVVEPLFKLQEPTEGFQDFEKARFELIREHAVLDEAGNPKIVGNNFEMSDLPAFNKAFEKLKKKYSKALDELEARNKEIKELLKTEREIEVCRIKLDAMPADLPANALSGLFPIITPPEA